MPLLSASAAITQLIADADLVHQVVTGPSSGAGSLVTINGAPVKTITKVIADTNTALASLFAASNVDGGIPSSTYGALTALDGGTP